MTGAHIELRCVIDSGFSGSILMESGTYRELGLDLTEKPTVDFPVYKTLAGTIILRCSHAKAKIGEKEFDVEVLTPVYGNGRNLIGRNVLREFTTLLHRGERACVGEARVEE